MNKQSAVFFRNFGVFRVFRIQGPRSQIFFIQQGVETRHGAQMQTERDSKCVAKNVDRLSDEVVVGTQIEPARASYQVGHHFFIQQGVGA